MWLAGLAALVVLGLAVLAWLVRQAEPQLAFFPTRGEDQTPAAFGVPFTALDATTTDGERIRIWHLPRPDARAQIVYFHGNGGNLSLWSDILVDLQRQGFDVVAFDYRGYGESTGRPSERGLYQDVDAVLALVNATLRRQDLPLLYWGRSLGSTLAAYAASQQAPGGVILEAGFPSMRAVLETNPVLWVLSWFASYEFPTARWMSAVRVPSLVIHGDRDSVIPYRLGRRLHDAIPGPKRFVTITGGDHNDAAPRDADAYWRAVNDFAQSLKAAPVRER
jgi:fermentation-respiration switch protein FrsA (DUF1100 family)